MNCTELHRAPNCAKSWIKSFAWPKIWEQTVCNPVNNLMIARDCRTTLIHTKLPNMWKYSHNMHTTFSLLNGAPCQVLSPVPALLHSPAPSALFLPWTLEVCIMLLAAECRIPKFKTDFNDKHSAGSSCGASGSAFCTMYKDIHHPIRPTSQHGVSWEIGKNCMSHRNIRSQVPSVKSHLFFCAMCQALKLSQAIASWWFSA